MLNEQQLKTHIPAVAWLLIVCNIIYLLLALAMFLMMNMLATMPGVVPDAEDRLVLPIVGTVIPIIIALLTIPDFIAAIGLLARKRWGRILGIVVGILNLPLSPWGPVVGVYTLFVLLQDQAQSHFERPAASAAAPSNAGQHPSGA